MKNTACHRCRHELDPSDAATVILRRSPDSPWGWSYKTHHLCGGCADSIRAFLGENPEPPPHSVPQAPPEPMPRPPVGCAASYV